MRDMLGISHQKHRRFWKTVQFFDSRTGTGAETVRQVWRRRTGSVHVYPDIMRESAGSTAIEPLPAGRHRLDPTAVAASQRYRIDFAALDVLAEKGYAAATVADIIASARVSRRTFYEFYANKGECFVAVCALATRIMAEELDAATDTTLPWQLQLRAHIQRYLEVLAAQPGAAYALTVQTFATPELRQAREAMFDSLLDRMRGLHQLARQQDRTLPHLPDALLRLLVGGFDELLRTNLRARDGHSLPSLAPMMTRAAIAILHSSGTAER